jgi:signal transduction histidine kinase
MDRLLIKSHQDFEKYLQIARESVAILDKNLSRTTELLNSFKQIALDQSSDQKRVFNLSTYLEEIMLSLRPTLKSTQHTIEIDCPANVTLYSYPGAFSQIVTNFVLNSLIHGFEGVQSGRIGIRASMDDELFSFSYQDNGRGIPEEFLDKLFDLFFTTKREEGSSGLGLHIIHNLVTQTFGGVIACESEPGQGAKFTIQIPASALKKI